VPLFLYQITLSGFKTLIGLWFKFKKKVQFFIGTQQLQQHKQLPTGIQCKIKKEKL